MGAEKHIRKNWAVTATAGQYFNSDRGWLIKGEVKYYDEVHDGHRTYGSMEYFYKHDVYNLNDSIALNPGYKKDYTMSRYVTALRIKAGEVITQMHGIIVDSYIGAGLRYRVATNTLTPQEYAHVHYNADGQDISRYIYAASRKIRPDFTLGVRIGFRY
jgi:hypothetical protein